MDLKQLKYFVTVVEEGTISAAAKKLFMSQPPLSTQMKLIEQELGCQLFERGQKHIKLTAGGRLLYDRAQTMLRMETVMRQDMAASARAEKDTVRIGVVSSVICTRAGEWISEFLAANSGVRFEIFESDTYSLIEKLRADIVHAVLVRTPFPENEFVLRSLSEEKMLAVCRRGKFSGEVTLREMSEQPLILYRRWENIIREEFARVGAEPHCVCVCDDARTAVNLAERTSGMAFVPASAAGLIHTELAEALPITDCTISSAIVLAHKKDAHFPDSVKRFADYLLEQNI